ncbi:GntR family transcriptional regulator [Bordetella ansorpii]|uniref:GntR family transcriptional regulator n=1 Tax=Bordetella ansorpii TaxID=288768 RepID=A0A157Q354_9BORD|nr:PLP-dependent aminotransferase family protein [Bordetella ansorpii]SAI40197.1 GntR family transcriptional regulator [Bordetella ansorpii]
MTPPPTLLDAPLRPASAGGPLQRQLLHRLKPSILDGCLPPGARLPASRELAAQLGISRNTVLIVYEHLAAEGYVLADRQGTRVAQLAASPATAGRAAASTAQAGARKEMAQPPWAASAGRQADREVAAPGAGLSSRAAAAPDSPTPRMAARVAKLSPSFAAGESGLPLRPGTPALSRFPAAAWRRSLDRALRAAPTATLGYGPPAGEPALRAAIATHLSVSRGVRCLPDQVVITDGAQEAINLCVRLLADPGETGWIENPGYRGARSAFRAADLRIVPVPVDAEGLAAHPALWRDVPPRLIYTSPSHQYPTGAVLSAARRLDLIARAAAHDAWIIEDDYDSEFRHHGEPIAAMQGMVSDAPVLYVGTFSKTLFPALRLGFAVLPPAIARQAEAALGELLRGGHRHAQLALADFIDSGQFARHLGRMRRLYRQRQQALRAALSAHLPVEHEVLGGHGGLHLTLRLPAGYPDQEIARAAQRLGMAPTPLSAFALEEGTAGNGLVLGYGNTPIERIDALVKQLAALIRPR